MKVDSSVPFEYKYLFNPIVDKGIYAGYLYVVQDYVRVAGDRWSDSSYEEVCCEINYTQELKLLKNIEKCGIGLQIQQKQKMR